MPKLSEVCHHLRSKNAGPFWITLDIFFADDAAFRAYAGAEALSAGAIGAIFDIDPILVKRFAVPDLAVVKLSFPRLLAQGGALERDMHGGQQYVRMLDVEI